MSHTNHRAAHDAKRAQAELPDDDDDALHDGQPWKLPTETPRDVEIRRDSLGYWNHPSIDWDLIPEECNASPYFEDMGYEDAYVTMESDAPSQFDALMDSESGDCSGWTPSRPDGDGWFLGAIYDTEGGPCAVWLRPLPPAFEPLPVQPGTVEAILADKDRWNRCRRCGGQMGDGTALVERASGTPDFPGGDVVTVSPDGTADLVPCQKCRECGWSVT